MRKLHLTKKTAAVAAVLTLGTGAAAYAYWTTNGAGTGSAANATSNGSVVLHGTFSDGLTPGASEAVVFTGDNAGSSNLYVGTIHSVVSTSNAACLPADFTVADFASNTIVPAATNGVALGSGSINFANTALDQDACKGATITLTLTSN